MAKELRESGFYTDDAEDAPRRPERLIAVRFSPSEDLDLDALPTCRGPLGYPTLLLEPPEAVTLRELVPSLARLLRRLADARGQAGLPTVFVRTYVDRVDDALFRLLLDWANLTLIHATGDAAELPFGESGSGPSASAIAVATLTQTGFLAPVEVPARPGEGETSRLISCCEQWNRVNRGTGLIIRRCSGNRREENAPHPSRGRKPSADVGSGRTPFSSEMVSAAPVPNCSEDLSAAAFADMLFSIDQAALLPAVRIAPLSGFISALGGLTSRPLFPTMYLGPADTDGGPAASATTGCAWHGLAGHVCSTTASGENAWQCRLADAVFPRLLDSLASETVARARPAASSSGGGRRYVTVSKGQLVFTETPVPVVPVAEGEVRVPVSPGGRVP